MRTAGTVRSARGIGAGDHVCWSFRDESELHAVVSDLVADATSNGDRFTYFGSRPAAELLADLSEVEGARQLIDRGAAQVVSFQDVSRGAGVQPPSAFLTAAEEAVDDGFSGLRALSDSTEVVRSEDGKASYLEWEPLLDRQLLVSPLRMVCAYDRSVLGGDVVDDIAALHPLVSKPARFQLFAADDADLAMCGELDSSAVQMFQRTLERFRPQLTEGRLTIDASNVRFLNHRILLLLDRYAETAGIDRIELRGAPSSTVRISALLDLQRLQVGRSR